MYLGLTMLNAIQKSAKKVNFEAAACYQRRVKRVLGSDLPLPEGDF